MRSLRMLSEVRDCNTNVFRHVVAFGTAGFLCKYPGEAYGVYYRYDEGGSTWSLVTRYTPPNSQLM